MLSNSAVFLTRALCQNFVRQVLVFCRIRLIPMTLRVGAMRKTGMAIVALAFVFTMIAPANAAPKIVKGTSGQSLSASVTAVKSGAMVTVTGKYFDETIGIYLGFCVVPKKGTAPTPCGGGVNKAGTGEASFWISSNPPPYGVGLAEEFLPGGRFTKKVKISAMVGKFDCRKIKCAISVRADHMRSEDRSYDLFIPITVK